MTAASDRNPARELVHMVEAQQWLPLDLDRLGSLFNVSRSRAGAAFRMALDLPVGPNAGRPTVGQVLIHEVDGLKIARCYACVGNSGGHRYFWRRFSRFVDNSVILKTAKDQVCERAFLGDVPPQESVPAKRTLRRRAARPVLPFARIPAPVQVDACATPPSSMSDADLLAEIDARRSALDVLEIERDARLQAAADVIARLKR